MRVSIVACLYCLILIWACTSSSESDDQPVENQGIATAASLAVEASGSSGASGLVGRGGVDDGVPPGGNSSGSVSVGSDSDDGVLPGGNSSGNMSVGSDTDEGVPPDGESGAPSEENGESGNDPSAEGSPGPDTSESDGVNGTDEGRERLAVTADFLNRSLSIVDLAKLKAGATRKDALVGTVDLSAYSPGPLDLAITPDGKIALVSISAGWLTYFVDGGVPPGNGTLVFVDLEQQKIIDDLFTGRNPMGVVITPDGKRAFVGHFSESYFAVVDIEKRTFERVLTGGSYNEELAIDDTGTTVILSYGAAGDCTTFAVSDPIGTRGVTVGTMGLDAGGVAFFPGTKTAFVVQAPTTLTMNTGGYSLVDASNPASPSVMSVVRVPSSPTIYPVTAVPHRQSVAYPATDTRTQTLSLVEMKLENGTAKEVQTIEVGEATNLSYGATVDPIGKVVLLAVPSDSFIAIVDLDAKTAFKVPWGFSKSGPTAIRVAP